MTVGKMWVATCNECYKQRIVGDTGHSAAEAGAKLGWHSFAGTTILLCKDCKVIGIVSKYEEIIRDLRSG